MKATATTAKVKVRCSGKLHTITVTESGAIVLHDHHQGTDRAFVALGGEKCRCLQVLEAWRLRDRAKLPAGLRPALDAAIKVTQHRRSVSAYVDPLTVPIVHRARQRVITAAEKMLSECGYRRSQSSWAGGDHMISVGVSDDPGISGSSDRVWSDNGKWSGTDSSVSATVPLAWFSRIYRRGLAVINGCFVLDIIAEDGKSITVLAGKQGRGFDVYPRPARIVTSSDGSRRLRWLREVA